MGGWIYSIASRGEAKLDAAISSTVNSTMWLSFTATRFAVALLSTQTGRVAKACVDPGRLLGASTVLGLLPLVFFLLAPASLVDEALWALAVIFGIASAVWFPNGMALGTQLVEGGQYDGVVVSIFELAANAGNGAGPALAGWLKNVIS